MELFKGDGPVYNNRNSVDIQHRSFFSPLDSSLSIIFCQHL
jgi:hypothetical protein